MMKRSFEEVLFQLPWCATKVSIVKPILKKSNLDPFDLKSRRPISNIGFVAKIIEHIAIQRFNSHIAAVAYAHQLPVYKSAIGS